MEQRNLRLGQAAEMLGVSTDTVRRWIASGQLAAERSSGGQRLVSQEAVAALASQRRRAGATNRGPALSARNRLAGVVTRVDRDRAASVVEVLAGPHRLVSLLTREAADELDLRPGTRVVCIVKATDVMVELAGD